MLCGCVVCNGMLDSRKLYICSTTIYSIYRVVSQRVLRAQQRHARGVDVGQWLFGQVVGLSVLVVRAPIIDTARYDAQKKKEKRSQIPIVMCVVLCRGFFRFYVHTNVEPFSLQTRVCAFDIVGSSSGVLVCKVYHNHTLPVILILDIIAHSPATKHPRNAHHAAT